MQQGCGGPTFRATLVHRDTTAVMNRCFDLDGQGLFPNNGRVRMTCGRRPGFLLLTENAS